MTSPCLSATPDDLASLENPALRTRRGGTVLEALPIPDEGGAYGATPEELVPAVGGVVLTDEKKDEETSSSEPTDSSTSTEVAVPKRTPLQRFRAIATTVKHNLLWARLLSKEDNEKSFVVKHEDGTYDQSMTFNVNSFKSNVQSMDVLPSQAKRIMTKNQWERTPSDLQYLKRFIGKLKFFDRYSRAVKSELAAVLYYESFNEGRVIVRQGHPGLSFYIVLTGTVIAEVTDTDKQTGEHNTQVIAEFSAGGSFGELALLNGTKRTATITCKCNCEFLRLDKPDFDMVLRRGYQQDWESRMNALRSVAAFGEWDEEELNATNDRARLVEYPPNTIILGDVQQPPDNIYFVKTGECKIVRDVTLIQSKNPYGNFSLSLPPLDENHEVKKDFELGPSQSFVHKHLHIRTLGKGSFFGVGEDLRKTYIISVAKVECLLVSRVAFMRHERGRSLLCMKQTVEELYPSYEESFASYLDDKKWRAYKHNLVKDLVSRRHIPTSTKITDVPLVLRRESGMIPYR